jgi:hypothetical protein
LRNEPSPNFGQFALLALLAILSAPPAQPCSVSRDANAFSYTLSTPPAASENTLGVLHIARNRAPIADLTLGLEPAAQPLRLSKAACGTDIALTFAAGAQPVNVSLALNLQAGRLSINIQAGEPQIAALRLSPWPSGAFSDKLAIPYYTGAVYGSSALNLFANSWFDWHRSNASKLSDTVATYGARTSGTRNPVHESIVIAISRSFQDVLPDSGNLPSPYIAELAGRLFLDGPGLAFETT